MVQDPVGKRDQKHMQMGSWTAPSVCHSEHFLSWKSVIQRGSKSGSICRNARTSNFCPTRRDQKRPLFIYFHFPHVKTSFSWRYFWTLAHLMHYLCSPAQPSTKITRLNVFCMFVLSLLPIYPPPHPRNGHLSSEVGQGWANGVNQVTSRCPCCFNYRLLYCCWLLIWAWGKEGIYIPRMFLGEHQDGPLWKWTIPKCRNCSTFTNKHGL